MLIFRDFPTIPMSYRPPSDPLARPRKDKKQPWPKTAICSIGRAASVPQRPRIIPTPRATSRCWKGWSPSASAPRMYIGGTDERALHHLVAEVLDNAMDEAVAGHADTIHLEVLSRQPRAGARQRPRHARRPASQVQEQVGARGHPHDAALRRQVQQQGLCDVRRPAWRRRVGGQCAVRRAGRRSGARSPVLHAKLLARQARHQAEVGRPRPQPARHDGDVPSRSADLRQARLRARAPLSHGAVQGLPVPRRRDPLEMRQVRCCPRTARSPKRNRSISRAA